MSGTHAKRHCQRAGDGKSPQADGRQLLPFAFTTHRPGTAVFGLKRRQGTLTLCGRCAGLRVGSRPSLGSQADGPLGLQSLAGRTCRLGIAFFALACCLRGLLLFLNPLSRRRLCQLGGTQGLGRALRGLDFRLPAFFFLPRQVVFAFRPPALGLDLFRSGLLGLARQRQGGLFGGKPLLGGKGRLRFDFAVLGTLPG
ncbi:MAG: hypothetical protein IPH39_10360 [Sulfuritalea sp.]|nr:hypothetical protein [Sulfuritalea sp.]